MGQASTLTSSCAARRPCSTARASPTWPSSDTPRATSTASELPPSLAPELLRFYLASDQSPVTAPRSQNPARATEAPHSGLALCRVGVRAVLRGVKGPIDSLLRDCPT